MKTAVNAREVVKRLKEQDAQSETASVTFRLPKSLLVQFKSACEREGVRPNAVAKELIQGFISQVKR